AEAAADVLVQIARELVVAQVEVRAAVPVVVHEKRAEGFPVLISEPGARRDLLEAAAAPVAVERALLRVVELRVARGPDPGIATELERAGVEDHVAADVEIDEAVAVNIAKRCRRVPLGRGTRLESRARGDILEAAAAQVVEKTIDAVAGDEQ